ncbi:MAG: purine-binding chemotaxis protein CheW [Okeania sp. SIO3B5]|uniref:chemotaxis protein CheW n=1 Tax=Okeania sp. SIO3B5 TaxID=2607811 RepID=UPI0013FF6E23|nr:chemotaxis protein CheW [Okeania sp. SIO3B5]NEO56069.1 purine-binding chemotaxis protein CheW [Okeania sp. SIO3B5]
MENKSYLIFLHNNCFYGIEALSVREIFLLPEVTAIAEIPDPIIGVINLRGDILPLMDLNIRLGYQQKDYSLTDNVVVIEWQQSTIGIIVNEVYEVKNIPITDITKELYSYGNDRHNKSHLVTGLAKLEEKLVILLSSKNLIQYIEAPEFSLDKFQKIDASLKKDSSEKSTEHQQLSRLIFGSNATSKERGIFQERAKKMRLSTQIQDVSNLMPLAVIGLNEEYFGIDLKVVREFTYVHKATPIPCTPEHIFGNINLRGEIITLVNIRGLLNMKIYQTKNNKNQALIFEVDDFVGGIRVDEIFDVIYLDPLDIKSIPATINHDKIHNEYLLGTAMYREKMMSIINFQKIITQKGLVVEQEV